MSDLRDLRDHLDSRLDRLEVAGTRMEDKLDDHLGRISKAEADLSWMKGAIRHVVAGLITLAGIILTWLLRK